MILTKPINITRILSNVGRMDWGRGLTLSPTASRAAPFDLGSQGVWFMRMCASGPWGRPVVTVPAGRSLRSALFSLLPLALTLAGCQGSGTSGSTYEVKGRILLANGKPLTAGRVTFVAADGLRPPASGDLGPDGGFALSTRDPGDGAVPGPYKVRIEPAESKSKTRRASRPIFPMKYIDEDSSGLAVTVRAEPNQLEPITLK